MTTARPGSGGRPPGWQQAHARRYMETGGQDGHIWEGVTTLLLTTKGRRSGEPRTTPLIYGKDGDRYLVVASRAGAPTHPDWYENLVAQPEVQVQVMADRFKARARPEHGGGKTGPVEEDDLHLARLRRVPESDDAGDPPRHH